MRLCWIFENIIIFITYRYSHAHNIFSEKRFETATLYQIRSEIATESFPATIYEYPFVLPASGEWKMDACTRLTPAAPVKVERKQIAPNIINLCNFFAPQTKFRQTAIIVILNWATFPPLLWSRGWNGLSLPFWFTSDTCEFWPYYTANNVCALVCG